MMSLDSIQEAVSWLVKYSEEKTGLPGDIVAAFGVTVVLFLATFMLGAFKRRPVPKYPYEEQIPHKEVNREKKVKPYMKKGAKIGDITAEELEKYDGQDPEKPLLMSVCGTVYDLSKSSEIYGPGGPYCVFAGKETSRALAKMSFDLGNMCDRIDDLSLSEKDTLKDWILKFDQKYPKVGRLVADKGAAASSARKED